MAILIFDETGIDEKKNFDETGTNRMIHIVSDAYEISK
jgi:hypothetical protein